MAQRNIYLIRHGHYELNKGHLVDGLTPTGVEQAQWVARRCNSFPITAIHCSTLPRAFETAVIIAREFPGVPLHRTRSLWECIPCVPRHFPQVAADITAEKMTQYRERAEKAFDKYFKRARGKDKHEILVCHGTIIRYFVCRVLQLQPDAWVDMDMSNCGMSVVQINSNGRMALVSHNDVGHLPRRLRTSLVGFEHQLAR